MKEDGTEDSAYYWWLRSAGSGRTDSIGRVDIIGSIDNGAVNGSSAFLPVCLIG